MNIVIPMAGLGSRFANVGYTQPKPLISVHGVPMIRLVIENIRPSFDHRFIFVCQKIHATEFGLHSKLEQWAPGCEIIEIEGITDGAARTVLSARELINDNRPLMIANSDQFVDTNIQSYLSAMAERDLDGLIMTMRANDAKWSYVRLDTDGLVDLVVEKEVVSPFATVGIYNFRAGHDFVRGADTMIAKDLRVNNEFYVAPVYNELIATGSRIGSYDIGSVEAGMYGLGTPADLNTFLALPLSVQVTKTLL